MKTFHVRYERRTTIQCYVVVQAEDAIAAANTAQELTVESDDALIEMPETYHVETNEIGEVDEVDEVEDVEDVADTGA